MFVRWNLTVCSVTQSSLPIAWFESPRATALRIDELALGQAGRLSEADARRLGNPMRVEDRPVDRLPDSRRQVERVHALDDVAARSVAERSLDPLGVAEDREDDHLDLRAVLLMLVEARRARPSAACACRAGRRPASRRRTSGSTWLPRARLADDLDVLRRLESAPDSFDHQAMVVRNKDLHGRSSPSPAQVVRISRFAHEHAVPLQTFNSATPPSRAEGLVPT